jgi:hypothetical protein
MITSLKTAVDNIGTLHKESIPYGDIFDAFRLSLKFHHLKAVATYVIDIKYTLLQNHMIGHSFRFVNTSVYI